MRTTNQAQTDEPKRRKSLPRRVCDFYWQGFKAMTVGRTLWLIIAIKLVVFFVIIKWIFFPNFLNSLSDTDEGKARYVRGRMAPRPQPRQRVLFLDNSIQAITINTVSLL